MLFLIAHFHKASLLMIGDQLVAALKSLDPDKPQTVAAFREETLSLQESFLRFSQRYFFTEVSGRAHVRDLFRMIRKHLNIDGLFAEVRGELFDLVQYLDSNALRKQNTSMHRLTVVAVVGLVATIVTGFLGINLIAEADSPLLFKIKYFGVVTMIVTVLVALAVIYSRPLANFLERLSGEKH
jgi:Mg2+ and Co2+ transporter CorA